MSAAADRFGVLAELARVLNAGSGADETLGAVAERLRSVLDAREALIWLREANGTAFYAVTAPPVADGPRLSESLDAVARGGGRVSLGLAREGDPVGLLQVTDPRRPDEALLRAAADLIGPYIASVQLSEDFASEVAVHSRAVEGVRRFTGLVVDSLPVGLYVVDRDYRIVLWNRKRETGTQGLRRTDVVGRSVFEVLTRRPDEQLRAEFDRVFETGAMQQRDLTVTAAEGARVYRLTRLPMRFDGDRVSHVLTIGEDVTDRREAQARVAESDKLAALGRLAAGVMHEINNPLATIAACAAAAEGRADSGDPADVAAVREYLALIEGEVDRCTGIVNGLLEFSRPAARERAPAALNEIVTHTATLARHHPRFGGTDLIQELEPGLPAVRANRDQLIQVLLALLLNALDAMPGGGRVVLRTRRGISRPGEVSVEVEDSGPGIPEAVRDRLFEPFFSTKPAGRGTGLGLSICYGIVERHEGRIEVESPPGRGAVFRVSLPVAEG